MDDYSYNVGYREGWNDALRYLNMGGIPERIPIASAGFSQPDGPTRTMLPHLGVHTTDPQHPKRKRKVSPYHKRLGREIKALRKRHMTKAGKWKKGWSQKRMMKTAHKNAKR